MRCPKCQYIGFDTSDRCRNCGYEFSLAVDEPPVDVRLAPPDDLPMQDFALVEGEPHAPGAAALDERLEEDPPVGRRITAADLPLFTERFADDQAPLVTPPAVPRPPLSVRRTNPSRERGRVAAEPRLDLAPEAEPAHPQPPAEVAGPDDTAGLLRRGVAGVVDLLVLGAVAAAVVLLTLRISGLTTDEWRMLPRVPMGAFLLLVCGGYFVLFTAAGGQTIGKMLSRIRVVAAPEGNPRAARRVAFSTALVRAVACFGSVVALGMGFLPALFSRDRRTFHDRLAGTHVVSA